jgi:hypothetical protein
MLQFTSPVAGEFVIGHRDAPPDIHFKGGLMLPRSGAVPARVQPQLRALGPDRWELTLVPDAAIAGGCVRIDRRDGHIVVQTVYRAASDHVLAAWTIAPPESRVTWNYLVNFRNRHGCLLPYKQVSLRGTDDGQYGAPAVSSFDAQLTTPGFRGHTGMAENTYSQDWQFAPHPTSFIFQAPRCNLLAGCLDLPRGGFGMVLEAKDSNVTRWEISLGGEEHGEQIKAGQDVRSPQFVFALDASEDVYHTARLYHDLLVAWRFIPDPQSLPTHASCGTPNTGTWYDQGVLARGRTVQYDEQGPVLSDAQSALTDELLAREIAVIRRYGSRWGLFILDDGWAVCRGDWTADPVRVPRLRERIDELHALGMKVLLWWAPFDIHPQAKMRQRTEWLCAGGKPGRHDMPLLDYSNPRVQEEYVKPLVRLWFSDAPGCYNADGIKTDFMADKIHPNLPVHNPDWRGEERFIFNTLKLVMDEGRKHKPELCHNACVWHPHFEQISGSNRCYDNGSTDYRIMFERARMLQAFQPANPVNTTADSRWLDIEECFAEALRTGNPLELIGVLTDGSRLLTEPEHARLAEHLRDFRKRWR